MVNTFNTFNGRLTAAVRTYTPNASLSATQYLPPTQGAVGVNQATPLDADNALTYPIPILNGTVIEPANANLTGSSGGDNSTDNTTTYKIGGGVTDNTSQNLIANGTNVSKIWTKAALATNATATQPFGMWIYIKDATALAKFKSSSTALEIRIGSDASNYYYKTFTASQLAVGWNWITSNTTAVNALSATGSPGTPLDTFVIVITTNNATDTFVAGDVLFDLLRQWATTDVYQNYVSGYPTVNTTTGEITTRLFINAAQALGFQIGVDGNFNQDTNRLMISVNSFTALPEKTGTDQYILEDIDQFVN